MRAVANLFMWMFLFDGCISVADELLRYNSADDGLLGLRMLIAFAVVIQAFIVYVALAFDRRLPKLILLPQTLFAFWGMAGLWPIPFFVHSDNLGVVIAGLQVSLGLLPFFMLRGGEGRGLLLKREQFLGSGFSFGNLLLGIAGSVVVIPVLLFILACAGGLEFVHNATAGFMTIDSRGITMEDRTYQRDDKIVRLTSMIHVGDQDYYDNFAASVDSGRTIILAEGVSDQDGVLTAQFNYESFANALGLSSQSKMALMGELIAAEDLDLPPAENDLSTPHILRADVDVRDFDPLTVEFLNVLGQEVLGEGDFTAGMVSYNEWVNQNMTQGRYETLMFDVITRRNNTVINYLGKALNKYDVIVIPWGALHMSGIEEGVTAQGFRLKETEKRLSVDFRTVDFSRLWEALVE